MSSVSHTLQKYFDMCALVIYFASQVVLVVKNPPTNAGAWSAIVHWGCKESDTTKET